MTNLPQGWEVKKLGEIGFFIRGVSYKKEQLLSIKDEKSVYLLRANNIQNELILDDLQIIPKELAVDKIIQNNDILFAMSSGSKHIVGKNILLNDLNDFTFGVFCGLFRINNLNISHKFLAFYLKSSFYKNYILNISKGSNINNLRFADLENLQIPLPPLEEQERIVGILDFAFSKIDENIKKAKENLANIDELMQSALQKVFNPLNDNTKENYQLPQFWEWKSLNSVVLKTSNVNPCDFNDDKFYYIDISSIDNKNFCICSIKNIDKQYAPSRARKDVLYGDILYATTRPNLKNIAINYYNFNNIVGSTGFCVLRANENLNNKYLFFFLLSDIFDNYISKFIRGAQYPSVSDKDIFNSKIPLPPLQEQEQIAEHLDFVFEKAKALKELYTKELKDYEELKQSLLDKAFKGEL
ncbi:TPA: restriction endonuclease subunit S [Campylobacter jejuni]|nr:restriction endonuclease subunit S [Campylobacter jejuni]